MTKFREEIFHRIIFVNRSVIGQKISLHVYNFVTKELAVADYITGIRRRW